MQIRDIPLKKAVGKGHHIDFRGVSITIKKAVGPLEVSCQVISKII